MSTNFSHRAVLGLEHFRCFLYWGVVITAYFFVLLVRLALLVPRPWLRRSVFALTLCACITLGYSLLIPYLPEDIPRWASLHVFLAAGSCVILMGALLLLLLHFRLWKLLLVWGGIILICALLFFRAGMVTSALEVFFTISSALLTRSLWLNIRSERSLTMEKKRFYRTEGSDAKLFGVCGGIAEYLDVDPSLVRILWVLATLCGSVGLWFYLACALILPKKSTIYPDL